LSGRGGASTRVAAGRAVADDGCAKEGSGSRFPAARPTRGAASCALSCYVAVYTPVTTVKRDDVVVDREGVGALGEPANERRDAVRSLQFQILGPVQVLDRDGKAIDVGGAKPRLVLVQLVLNPNRVVSTDALVDALWGQDPPPTARRSLQSHVAKLRAALGGDDGPIDSRSPGYVLSVDEDQIDFCRSEELVRQARAALLSDPRRARELAEQARQQWIGEPLGDLAEHDQLVPQRRRLDRLWLDLIELELDAELALGDNLRAVERLESLILDRSQHEPFWGRLMTAYYRLGRQSDALEAFQRARAALLDALGVDPSPELQRLEMAILGQFTELGDVHVPACPYKGLASYQLDDAEMFYGRDDLIAELVEAVRAASFVVVVGNSGVGKSSALRAGLVKAIETRKLSGVRQAAVITPGIAPLRAIYQVPGWVGVVVVDQFEELFTLTDDEATQREFVRLLVARVNDGSWRVVISLRADFFGRCTTLPELAPLLARRQVIVGPLSEHELRVAITGPAEKAGLVVAPELVDVIVAEAANHAGALPLVSHALVETWHRRTEDHLTLAAYRDAGSIAGAIARTAERVYEGFKSAQRLRVERLFMRLIEPGDGTDHTRRNVPYGQLEGSSINREEIDTLVEARLLTADADGIEIAHEALIESWPRLKSWIDDDRDGIRMHRHLTSAASAWDELGRDEGELYRGARLAAALSWINDAQADLSDHERDFIDASFELSGDQLRQQVRANRRLRVLVAASVVGVVVAAVGTVVAVSQAKKADRGRSTAEATQLAEMVRAQPDLSASAELQLAVEAQRRASTPTTKGLLLDAIAHDPGTKDGADLGVELTGTTPISSNGGILAGIDDNVLGVILDAGTLQPLVHGLRPSPVVAVDTGSRLLGVMMPTLSTVDLKTNEIVGPPPGVTAGPSEVALSPDGTTLAIANHDQDARSEELSLFDVASGQLRNTLGSFVTASLRAVGFSPDSRYVFAINDTNRAVVWDAATGSLVFTSEEGEPVAATRLAMSPSSRVIARGLEDGRVEVWASDDGFAWLSVGLQSNRHEEITWIDFDSRSQRMVTTSRDGVAVVWDTATGDVVAGPQDFRGKGGVTTFFRPGSSTTLLNVDSNGHTVEWELPLGGLSKTVPGVNLGATVSASPDTRVPVLNAAGVTVYDPSDGTPRQVPFAGKGSSQAIAVSEDGKRFLVAYDDAHLELRDMRSGDLITALEQRPKIQSISAKVNGVVTHEFILALDRGATHLALPTQDNQVAIVDDRGTITRKIDLPPNVSFIQALDLNDDGSELVFSTKTGEAIWYALDGSATATLAPSGSGFDAQFVSGGRVAVVGKGGAQVIDPRSQRTTERLPFGVDVTRFAVDSTGRLLATVDATGGIQLWDAGLVVRIGAPLHVQSTDSSVPIRFSPDGHYLVVSGPKETTWIDVWAADWPGLACNLVSDKLSSEERARYLGSRTAPDSCP
jgi:DNA-binding SARP family transcriptional activator/WD40 repeat protein